VSRRRASAPHSRSARSSDAQTAVDGARWDTWSTLLVVQTLVQEDEAAEELEEEHDEEDEGQRFVISLKPCQCSCFAVSRILKAVPVT